MRVSICVFLMAAGGGRGSGGGGSKVVGGWAGVSLKQTVVSTRKGNLTMSVLLTRRELANRDLTKQQLQQNKQTNKPNQTNKQTKQNKKMVELELTCR